MDLDPRGTLKPSGTAREETTGTLGVAPSAVPVERALDPMRRLLEQVARTSWDRSSPEARSRLSHLYGDHEAPDEYTQELALAFAAQYLTINYDKYRAALGAAGLDDPRSVLDVGAGSGAFSAAVLSWSAQVVVPPRKLVLLDRSRAQLQLADTLLLPDDGPRLAGTWGDQRVATGTDIRMSHGDLLDDSAELDGYFDLVLAGHVLTENADRLKAVLAALAARLAPNGAVLAVEQVDDPLWPELDAACAAVGLTATVTDTTSVGHRPVSSGDSRWVLLRHERAWQRALLDKYVAAWRRQDTTALGTVFSQDAIYHEKPFETPLVGLPEIQRYWRLTVERQQHPCPRLRRVLIGEDEMVAEWQTDMTRVRDGHRVHTEVRGALWTDTDAQLRLVRHLREYFRVHDTRY